MHNALNRETFIALRAAREAHQIAREVLNPPLDPNQLFCRHCGFALEALSLDAHDHIRCHACGRRTDLSPELARPVRQSQALLLPEAQRVTAFPFPQRSVLGPLAIILLLWCAAAIAAGLAYLMK